MSLFSTTLEVYRDGESTGQQSPAIEELQSLPLEDLGNKAQVQRAVSSDTEARLPPPDPTPRDEQTESANAMQATTTINKEHLSDAASDQAPVEATVGMLSSDRPRATNVPYKATALYQKIAKLQNDFFTAQTQLSYEREGIIPKLSSLNDSIAQLSHILEQANDQKLASANVQSWRDACKNFAASRHSFDAQMQLVNELEEKIVVLEFQIAKWEPRLLQMLDADLNFDRSSPNDMPDASPTLSRQSSPGLPPLARRYFDKRGDLRLLQDRLEEHLAELQSSDNEQAESPTDFDAKIFSRDAPAATFHQRWQMEHDKIRQELQEAQEQLTALWHECRTASINVGSLTAETQRVLGISIPPMPLEQPASEPVELDPPPFMPTGMLSHFVQDFRATPLLETFSNFSKKRELIEEWVGKIPIGRAGPQVQFTPPEALPDAVVPAPRSEPERSSVYCTANDVAPSDGYVMVPTGGRIDPNCEPGFFRRFYSTTLRPLLSEDPLYSRFQQSSSVFQRGSPSSPQESSRRRSRSVNDEP